jgi:hypothetical protein
MNVTYSEGDFYPAMWEPVLRRGEDIDILFGRLDGEQPQWRTLSHLIYDGVGGLAHLLRELRISETRRLPRIADKYWPSRLGLFAAQARMVTAQIMNLRARHISPWRAFRPGGQKRTILGWTVLSREETTAIRAAARGRNLTVNTLLLWALNRLISSRLTPGKRHGWCVPVNLRGAVTGRPDTHNHLAWVFPRLAPDETLPAVHERVQAELLAGAAAAAYHFTRLSPRTVGSHTWRLVGTFSNLGDWTAVAPEEHVPWLFSPPALTDQPLAGGTVTISGRLSLLLRIHESIQNDGTNFSADDWKRIAFEFV